MIVRRSFSRRWVIAIALVCLTGVVAAVLAIVLPSSGSKQPTLSRQDQALAMKLAPLVVQMSKSPEQRKELLAKLQPFAKMLHVKPAQLEQMAKEQAQVLEAREKKAQASAPPMLNVAHTLPLSMRSTPAPASRGPLGQVEDVSFLNPKHGFLVSFSSTGLNTGTALIEASNDGGVNWTTVWSRAHTWLSWIGFVDARHGFATGIASPSASTERPLLLSSSDGGRSWRAVTPSLPASPHGSWTMTTARGSWPGEFRFLSDQVGFTEPNPDNVWGTSEPPILRTGDGGRHWTVVRSPRVTFTAVDFLDTERGFATGYFSGRRARSCGSAVFSTSDSGRHWHLLGSSCRHDGLTAIDALNERSIFAGGGQPYYSSASGKGIETLIGTSDGGKSWQPLSRGPGSNPIVTLRFFDAKHGLASSGGCKMGENGPCGGQVLISDDGGRSWKGTTITAGQIDLVGANEAWVVPSCENGCGVIFHSHNRGESWLPVARPENTGLGSLQTAGTALLLSGSAGTFRSTDGGKSWRSVPTPAPPGAAPWAQKIVGPGVIASLEREKISISQDGGRSWRSSAPTVSNGYGISAVAFQDAMHGLAAQEGSNCSINGEENSRLFATSDGGKSWQTLPTPSFEIEQLAATPDLFVVIGGGAVCGQPLVGISRDGGRSWTLRSLPKNASCSPSVAAPETVWLSCGDYLLTSSDGGSSWSRLVKRHLSITSAVLTTSKTGWLVRQVWGTGDNSIETLWRSGDGGRTWVERWPALPIVATSDKR